jgi:ubiquinone/menaquinone biosynthesis C-methylase UbiE
LKVLDVACGSFPKGDINCDLFIGKDNIQQIEGYEMDVTTIPNFIQSDCQKLPFPNDSFEILIASHVLEHLDYPMNALIEFKRVSSFKVIIGVPNLFYNWNVGIDGEYKEHIYTWSESSLRHFMERQLINVSVIAGYKQQEWFRKGFVPKFVNMIIHKFLSRNNLFNQWWLIGVGYCQ